MIWNQIIANSILIFSQLVYSLVGFGSGMISLSLLAFLFNLKEIIPVILIINIFTEVYVFINSKEKADNKKILFLLPGIFLGTYIGATFLTSLSDQFLKKGLGVFVVFMGIYFLGRNKNTKENLVEIDRISDYWALPSGLISGILSGLFGTSGPPLIMYLQLIGLDKITFRATLMTTFMLMGFYRFIVYFYKGLISLTIIKQAGLLMPGVILGTWIGNKLHYQSSEKTFQNLVVILLIFSGILLIF